MSSDYERSQAAGVALLLSIARKQRRPPRTLLLPRCPDDGDQYALLEAEIADEE
ncbi:MAG TPA: hypothetical protein VGH54_29445 [Mycobacterium sp.]|uniref:hypothetical protein n=1 Tax=Mycobacterium sp. TaxID=1785 RepID=UPI002F424A6E